MKRIILLVLLFIVQVNAATFYCDPVNGNTTTGDGSAELPWGTFESVAAAKIQRRINFDGEIGDPGLPVAEGDTVILKDGYHGKFVANHWHSNGGVMDIRAAIGETPVISYLDVKNFAHWSFTGITFKPEDGNAVGEIWPTSCVRLRNQTTDPGQLSHDMTWDSCHMLTGDYATTDPWALLEVSDIVTDGAGTTLTSATGGFTEVMVGRYILLEGDGVDNGNYTIASYISTNSITIDANAGAGASEIFGEVDRFRSDGANGITISGGYADLTIRDCLIENVLSGITTRGDNQLITGNTIQEWAGDGITVGFGDNSVISYNTLQNFRKRLEDTHSDAIVIDGDVSRDNLIIRGNKIIGHTSEDAVRTFPESQGTKGIWGSSVPVNWLIENNLIVLNKGATNSAISLSGGVMVIVNNTCVSATDWPSGTPKIGIAANTSVDVKLRNNIVMSALPTDPNITASNNIIAAYSDLANLLHNYDAYNYEVKAGSDLIDAGTTTNAPTIDIDQEDRDANPDIGAYEYLGSDTTAPLPNPATFSTPPEAISGTSITMTATTTTDDSTPVEYFFNETSGNAGGSDSEWQSSNIYTDTGLASGTQYTYRVRSRDGLGNIGGWSSSISVTTEIAVVSVDSS